MGGPVNIIRIIGRGGDVKVSCVWTGFSSEENTA